MPRPDLRASITQAVQENGIADFEFLGPYAWEPLLHRLAERFLARGVLDLACVWWWTCWKNPSPSHQPEDALAWLGSVLPEHERFWFIASEEDGKYWVAQSTGGAILRILREMHAFEYYVVPRRLEWIICENHHGVLSGAGTGGPLNSIQ